MPDEEEDEFDEEEDEFDEEDKDVNLQRIIDETPIEPSFRRLALHEIAPVLDQAETGVTLEQGVRGVFIQRDEDEQESGIYDTDNQRGENNRPGEAYTRVEDYAGAGNGEYDNSTMQTPDGSSGRMITGSMPGRFENPWGARQEGMGGSGMASGMNRTGAGNVDAGFQSQNYDPAEEKAKREKRRM